MTGLHACGSLTVSIIQTLITLALDSPDSTRPFQVRGMALVGCCYNLLSPPLPDSTRLSSFARSTIRPSLLTPAHLQLAAQDPKLWDRPGSGAGGADDDASLGVRRVVYRAMLERELVKAGHGGRKVGKCKSRKPFESWRTYLEDANGKIEGGFRVDTGPESEEDLRTRSLLEFWLAVVHTLRCSLGCASPLDLSPVHC